MANKDDTTDFGYQKIPRADKNRRVEEVFNSVADRYDLMNDLMSLGIHRLWKRLAVELSGLRPGQRVLDVAAGSGDLAMRFANRVGSTGLVVLTDINARMLEVGRRRLVDRGLVDNLRYVQADAGQLPFADDSFDCLSIGFGLRNLTHKAAALSEMTRCLKPGGRLLVLEFSRPVAAWLGKVYDGYSFGLLPWLGGKVTGDRDSYRYLVESIRRHPDQQTLLEMLREAGLENCRYHNMSGGIVALHRGVKP